MTLEDVIRTLSRTEACLWEQYDLENDPKEREKLWNELVENHETMEEVKWLKDHEVAAKMCMKSIKAKERK